jgi:hypothetical protein
MLPGFRFLFAAIVLSMSVLVFGLGAAALLRAAHEQFASVPSRRALPEPTFPQQSEPTLALLRVEPAVADKASDDIPISTAPAEQAAYATPPAEPEKLAALKPEDASPPQEIAAVETSLAPAQAEAPASVDEPKLAALAETPPPASEAASTAPEPVAEAPSVGASVAATRIATLGGPAVTIEAPASAKAGAIGKPTKARRRIVRRARVARQAPPPAPLDPFAPAVATVRSR